MNHHVCVYTMYALYRIAGMFVRMRSRSEESPGGGKSDNNNNNK